MIRRKNNEIEEQVPFDVGSDFHCCFGSGGSFPNYDYATIKYNANGVQQWLSRYNGIGNGEDRVFALFFIL
jgi:hypothetical protein